MLPEDSMFFNIGENILRKRLVTTDTCFSVQNVFVLSLGCSVFDCFLVKFFVAIQLFVLAFSITPE